MKPDKIRHLDPNLLERDDEKHRELALPDDGGNIFCYHPFKGMQILLYDIHSSGLPDLWQNGFRRGNEEQYTRLLICKQGGCAFTLNGKTGALSAGNVMVDYGVGDNKSFSFTTGSFTGAEISMQLDTLAYENAMMKMLRIVIESMGLPEEVVFNSDGYVYSYSKNTDQTLDKLLSAGFGGAPGIMTLAQSVEIIYNLATDLKEKQQSAPDRQTAVAEDIHHCLTENFGEKYTAAQFAEKYGVSDTTVKKYFKSTYGYGFKEYQTKVRMEWAAKMLATTDKKVGEISEGTGYSKQTKFTKAFKQYYGVTPLVYRRSRRVEQAREQNKEAYKKNYNG